jgi:hypothetical protein
MSAMGQNRKPTDAPPSSGAFRAPASLEQSHHSSCVRLLTRCARLGDFVDTVSIGSLHGVDLEMLADSEVRVDILPHHAPVARHLEKPTEPSLIDQRVTIWQALCVRQPGTIKVRDACLLKLPDDLLANRPRPGERAKRSTWAECLGSAGRLQDGPATIS